MPSTEVPECPRLIYHITTKELYEKAKAANSFVADSLESEGFIHTSTLEQTIPTANRFYKNLTETIVLVIDSTKVEKEIKLEYVSSLDTHFPHIFGPINLSSIAGVLDLQINSEKNEFIEESWNPSTVTV